MNGVKWAVLRQGALPGLPVPAYRKDRATKFRRGMAVALVLIAAVMLNLSRGALAAPVIETVAGGFTGDGGSATSAELGYPGNVVVDTAGDLYIADTGNALIRKVDTSGNITTVAGNGAAGYSGDGGPATSAGLNYPVAVAIDSAGDLYIADTDDNRIRKVDAQTGIITTVAGSGIAGYSGDNGPAISAELNNPQFIAVDTAGDLYIADTLNNRIRKVDAQTGIITTVAGNGTEGYSGDNGPATNAELDWPVGIALDTGGDLYIADFYNCRIRKVNSSGNISTVAGNGTEGYSGDNGAATSAELDLPSGVALDAAGNLYISDHLSTIRKVVSGIITTVVGNGTAGYSGDNGPATSAELSWPGGLAFDSAGDLYIADSLNERIRKVDTSGNISTVAGGNVGDGRAATDAALFFPMGMAMDSAGDLYIADSYNERIRKVDSSGNITTVAGDGLRGYGGDSGQAASAWLYYPEDVALDAAGDLYIADSYNNRIRKVDTSGKITTVAGVGTFGYSGDSGPAISAELNDPLGVAVDTAGDLYIADTDNNVIRKVDTSGNIITMAGNGTLGYSGDNGSATSAELASPVGVALDAAGDLYIADTGNNRIRKVDTSGKITTVAGNGTAGYSGDGGPATSAELNDPSRVAVDSAGDLYIADTNNHRIRKVDTSGKITTVAGNGTYGYSGDGGPATSAELDYPEGVVLNSTGTALYVGDFSNRIRKVTLTLTDQTITFGTAPTVIVGETGTVSATASSGLAVTFTSQTSSVCTVSGSTVTGVTTGTCTIAADQAGNANYNPAPEVTQSFAINPIGPPGSPSITEFKIGNGKVTISFDPPASDGGSPITGYIASCSASGQPTQQATGTASPLTVTGLTNGVAYSCSVAATNAKGNGTATDLPKSITPHKPDMSWLMLLLD